MNVPLSPADRKRLARAGRGFRLALTCDDLVVIDRAYGDDVTVWHIALDGAHCVPWRTFRAAIVRHYQGDLDAAEQAAYDELIGE